MPKQSIKEIEECDCINGFIKHLATQRINAKLVIQITNTTEHIFRKQLSKGSGIPDAIIEIDGQRSFIEIITISRDKNMRIRISKHRNNCLKHKEQQEKVYSMLLLSRQTLNSLVEAIQSKCSEPRTA